MQRVSMLAALVLTTAVLAGCSGKPATSSESSGGSTASATEVPATSAYDQGPRASESPVEEDVARRGEALFQSKGCSACHGFGKRISCPDLIGVPQQRTAKWMEQQILHPEVMTKTDPIAKQLMAQYLLQMPNQGLTPDEAGAVIEFIKMKNLPAHESHESKEKEDAR